MKLLKLNKSIASIVMLIFVLNSLNVFSQSEQAKDPFDYMAYNNLDIIVPEPPNVAKLKGVTSTEPNYFTGAVSESIGIYTISAGMLKVPILLNYSTNGMVVDKVSSWVGLDWGLNIGGSVSRVILDQADENSFLRRRDYDFNTASMSNEAHDFLKTAHYLNNDEQPDYFSYNIPGYNGNFVIDDNESIVQILQSPIQILFYEEGNMGSMFFTFITPEGIRYDFNVTDESKFSSSGQGSCPRNFAQESISNWHLSRIVSPYGDTISYHYKEKSSFSYSTGITESYYFPKSTYTSEPNVCREAGGNICESMVTQSNHVIDYILSSNGDSIQIYSSKDGRLDLNESDYKLDSIEVYNVVGDCIVFYKFDYDFYKCDMPHKKNGRMLLKKLWEGKEESLKYSFKYNDVEKIPYRLSRAKDHWGFANGVNSNTSLIPLIKSFPVIYESGIISASDREPNFVYGKAGILTEIVFPTGGSREYEYEAHSYYGEHETYINPEVYIDKIEEPTGVEINLPINIPVKQEVIFSFSADYEDTDCVKSPGHESMHYELLDQNNDIVFKGDVYASSEIAVNESFIISENNVGIYTLKLELDYYEDICPIEGGYSCLVYEGIIIESVNIPVGGTRVRSIIEIDPITNISHTKDVYYNFLSQKNNSSGEIINTNPIYYDVSEEVISWDFVDYHCEGYELFSNSRTSLSSVFGKSHIVYPVSCVLNYSESEGYIGGKELTFKYTPDMQGHYVCCSNNFISNAPWTNTGFHNGTKLSECLFSINENGVRKTSKIVTYNYEQDVSMDNEVVGVAIRKRQNDVNDNKEYKTICPSVPNDDDYYWDIDLDAVNLLPGQSVSFFTGGGLCNPNYSNCYAPFCCDSRERTYCYNIQYENCLPNTDICAWITVGKVWPTKVYSHCWNNPGDTLLHSGVLSHFDVQKFKYLSRFIYLNKTVEKTYNDEGLITTITTNTNYNNRLLPNESFFSKSEGSILKDKKSYPTDVIDMYEHTWFIEMKAKYESIHFSYSKINQLCENNHEYINDLEEQLQRKLNDFYTEFNQALSQNGFDDEIIIALIYAQLTNQIAKPVEENRIVDGNITDGYFHEYQVNDDTKRIEQKGTLYLPKANRDENDFSFVKMNNSNEIVFENQEYEKDIVYDKYNDKGNLLQYHYENNNDNAIVYAYNRRYPVIVGENITYDELYAAVVGLIGEPDVFFENLESMDQLEARQQWMSFNRSLRNQLPNCRIRTFAYRPSIGLRSQVDPNSNVSYFFYDTHSRLKTICGSNPNDDLIVVKHLEYNYIDL